MMVRKQIGVGGAFVSVLAATVMTVSACSSGGGSAEPAASSSARIQSASVAPGVEKDSVLDLNSTKDMTGVVTTVPIGKSPYDKNMPDICNFITPAAMTELGVETKKKGFYGSPLVYQACLLRPAASFTTEFTLGAGIFVNNIQEHLGAPSLRDALIRSGVSIAPKVEAYELRDRATNKTGGPYSCEVAWGTFYGTASINIIDDNSEEGICDRTVAAAKILQPLLPKSPSQMRPTS
ncbi:MAG: hypothetical protein NTW76_12225 [Corynebacteriales bacterium]|nr:hypothetical protein [Mycobacteriales bacterium]